MEAAPPLAQLSFQELTGSLNAKHEQVLAQLAELRSENAALRARLHGEEEALADGAPQMHAASAVTLLQLRAEGGPPEIAVEAEQSEQFADLLTPRRAILKRKSTKDADPWPTWEKGVQPQEEMLPRGTTLMDLGSVEGQVRGGDMLMDEGCLQKLVLRPNCKFRTCWDLVSVFVLCYDILMIPMSAFELKDTNASRVIDMATTTFWSADIWMCFVSGYHTAGLVEMRPRKIAKQYLTQWFIMDLSMALIDWTLFFVKVGVVDVASVMRMGKLVRISRIFRLFRLLRLMKMPSLLDNIAEYVQGDAITTAFEVGKAVALIAVINHFIACGWYAVGKTSGQQSWLEELDREDRDLGYRYTTCLHWSLTQFTPASMEIVPRNTLERAYAIIVLFSALVTFGSFVSSITSAMTTLRQKKDERFKENEKIKRFISDNRISLDLSNRISAFFRAYKFMVRRRVHAEDIVPFKVLPERLLLQLHWETFGPILLPHPLFHHVYQADGDCLLRICREGMGELSLASAQELFTEQEEAHSMYFMVSGSMEYIIGPDLVQAVVLSNRRSADDASGALPVGAKQLWISEAVLWVRWHHKGRLVAISPSEFFVLKAITFRRMVVKWPEAFQGCKEYAMRFRARLMDLPADCPRDTWAQFDELQEMAQDAFSHVNSGSFSENSAAQTRASFVARRQREADLEPTLEEEAEAA